MNDELLMSVGEARELAVRVHGEQRDRDGSFHISHVSRVAEQVPLDDAHQRVAWLHDVIEDGELSADELAGRLAGEELQALVLLTRHDPHEPYADYISRIINALGVAGELACSVKQADLLDNLRRCARDHDPAVEQYGRALAALWTTAPRP